MMKLFHLLFPLILAAPNNVAARGGNILVLGDSWAALSQDFLSVVCGLTNPFSFDIKKTANTAISGTTAAEWAASEKAKEAFEKNDYDYVWLSLGGNDFLDSACDLDLKEQVSADIIEVISHIIESTANPDLKILYLGYAIPSEDVCGGGTTATLFETVAAFIAESIQSSIYADSVKLIDITEELVTSASTPLSDSQWFADAIHMNEDGYIKIFGMPSIQDFFGCVATTSAPSVAPVSSTTNTTTAPSSAQPEGGVPTTSSAQPVAETPTTIATGNAQGANAEQADSPGISTGLVIGLVALAVILLKLVLYFIYCRKSAKERNNEKEEGNDVVVVVDTDDANEVEIVNSDEKA